MWFGDLSLMILIPCGDTLPILMLELSDFISELQLRHKEVFISPLRNV